MQPFGSHPGPSLHRTSCSILQLQPYSMQPFRSHLGSTLHGPSGSHWVILWLLLWALHPFGWSMCSPSSSPQALLYAAYGFLPHTGLNSASGPLWAILYLDLLSSPSLWDQDRPFSTLSWPEWYYPLPVPSTGLATIKPFPATLISF